MAKAKGPTVRLGSEVVSMDREVRVGDMLDLQPILVRLEQDDATVLPELVAFMADALDVEPKRLKRLTYTELGVAVADFAAWMQAPATPHPEPKRQSPARSRSK